MRFFTSFSLISSSFQQLSRKIVNNAKNRNWRNLFIMPHNFSPVKPIASVVFQPWLHFHFLHFNFKQINFLFQIQFQYVHCSSTWYKTVIYQWVYVLCLFIHLIYPSAFFLLLKHQQFNYIYNSLRLIINGPLLCSSFHKRKCRLSCIWLSRTRESAALKNES